MVDIPTSRAIQRHVPNAQMPRNAGVQPMVGRALESFGGDIARAGQFLDQAVEEERFESEQAENVEAERRFLEFQRKESELAAQARNGVAPGGTGFAEGLRSEYIQRAGEFRQTLPERLRDSYEVPLFRVEDKITAQALDFERGARREFFGGQISDGLTAIEGSLFANPADYDDLLADGVNLIMETPDSVLSQSEKAAQVRAWEQKAKLATLNGVTPEERLRLLGGIDDTSKSNTGEVPKEAAKGISPEIQSIIRGAADRHDVPEEAMRVVAWLESRGNPRAQNPNSTAGGLYQQLDSNARAYGVEDKLDPYQSADGAARFMAENQARLRRVLGREPTIGELYLAHQQGPGGAVKLLSNPEVLAVDLVGRDQVTLNGGTPDMTGAEFAQLWLKKAGDTHVPNGGITGASFDPDKADPRFADFDYISAQKAIRGAQGEISALQVEIAQEQGTFAEDLIAWNLSGRTGDQPPAPDMSALSPSVAQRVEESQKIGAAVQAVATAELETVPLLLKDMKPSGEGFASEKAIYEAAQDVYRDRFVSSMAGADMATRQTVIQGATDRVIRDRLTKQQSDYRQGLEQNQVGLMRQNGFRVPDLDANDIGGSISRRHRAVGGFAERNGVDPVLMTPEERMTVVDSFNEMDLAQKISFLQEVSTDPAAGNAFLGEISKSAPLLGHIGGMLNNGGNPDAAMIALRGYQAGLDGMRFEDISQTDRTITFQGETSEALRGMPDVMATADRFAENYARGLSIANGGQVSPDDYAEGLIGAVGETYRLNPPGLRWRTKYMLLPPGVTSTQMNAFFGGMTDEALKEQNDGQDVVDAEGRAVEWDYIHANADYMTVGPGLYVVEFDGEPLIGADGGPFTLRYQQ